MAGLWDKSANAAAVRINTHLLVAAIKGYGTGVFTAAQVKAGLETVLGDALTSEEAADLTAIAAALDGQATTTAKLVYVSKVEAVSIAAELGLITEAAWRAALGIN